ncbi:ack-related non-receptor tyrosine kinase-like isoform X1 [Liolophura sinensis]|uniref:ack-related non-receptor tyrosine kinase-like isoform X1 n=1 Tax=Liolophura sinensis TaxID=3198878 RepID=UPI0031599513
MASSRELYNFLLEAELQHYHNALRNELKITSSHQLKYVKEEDLIGIGMSKPEMRRLKKYYKKEYPQGIEKIYRAIKKTGESSSSRTLSPPPPEHRLSRPSYIRGPGKQIIPSECLAIHKTLGEGEFGVVQQGIWTTEDGERVQVAIKCLSKERMVSAMADFLKEAGIMQSIDHDHMVRMFGVVLDKENTLMLVTELAPMRSLLECLKEPSLRLDFPIPRLCDFAQQICDGMSYLESKRFIHRDLAARNVLVFSKNQVKISDFGLSRALGVGKDYYKTKFTSTLKLPIAWCAPESITYLKFTSSSDSWSYGVTLWEMFTYGFQPWAGLTGQQILETIDKPKCQRLEKPDLCPKEYYDLMLKCWEHDCSERPTFSQMFLRLPQIRPMLVKAVKDYPSPVVQKDYLFYKAYDVVIVLDKNPENPPEPGLWKGVLNTGKSGFFDPTNTVPFVEPKTSPIERHKPIVRRESARKSGRRLRLDMIGKPMDDLRHTGHIGYDGAIFGDVSFIGDNVDKLPVKHGNTSSPDDTRGSSISLPRYADSPERNFSVRNSQSELSLGIGANGIGHSWMSKESLESQSTINTNSLLRDGEKTPPYQDIDDDLDNFKFPDLSSSLDLGPSFMDEVFKALKEQDTKTTEENDEPPTPTPRTTPSEVPPSSSPPPPPAPKPRFVPKPTPARREEPVATVKLPEPMEVSRSSFLQEERQSTNTRDFTPPPLPTQPPRVDIKKDTKYEVTKKQAKVKPLSASDERMIDDAISMAKEISSQVTNSHMKADSPPVQTVPIWPDTPQTDGHTSPESPKLIDRLKHSLKRSSPKSDRKQTFSEELENKAEMSDDFPPESQEAYNILVVRGADKDKEDEKDKSRESQAQQQNKKYGQTDPKPVSRLSNGSKVSEPFNSTLSDRYGSKISEPYGSKVSEPYGSKISEPYGSKISEPYGSKISEPYGSKILEPYGSKISEPYKSKVSGSHDIKEKEPYYTRVSETSSKVTEHSSSKVSEPVITSRIPEPSRLAEQSSSRIPEPVASRIPEPTSRGYSSKPVPRPRVELKKPSEPPPPRPRPEVQRVEPTVRSTSSSGSADPHRFLKPAGKPPKAEVEEFDDNDLNKNVGDLKRSSRAENSSLSSSSSTERDIEKTDKRETKTYGFEEEFSEPSPREIMSRLRESKMRRSIDHQSVEANEPPTPPRNLREPQGIPGRKGSAASTNEDEEEQDTNPLRMLRGGAIPIRGGRTAPGRRIARR